MHNKSYKASAVRAAAPDLLNAKNTRMYYFEFLGKMYSLSDRIILFNLLK